MPRLEAQGEAGLVYFPPYPARAKSGISLNCPDRGGLHPSSSGVGAGVGGRVPPVPGRRHRLRWMRALVDRLQFIDNDVGIPSGSSEVRMPQDRLDVADVYHCGPLREQARSWRPGLFLH